MDKLLTSIPQWTVSAHSSGEVLAVRAQSASLELALVGAPPGFTAAQVESWLSELLGVTSRAAIATPPADAATTSLPVLLHQALTGLLFFDTELWGRGEQPRPCAIAFTEGNGKVALGWTGSGRVELFRNGSPVEPEWMRVRDEQGREARAFVADAREPLSLRATWTAGPEDSSGQGGTIEADWPGVPEAPPQEIAEAAPQEPEPSAASEPSAEPPAPETTAPVRSRGRGFWRFRGWMDRLSGASARQEKRAAREREAAAAAQEPIAHDVPGVPALIPEPAPGEVPAEGEPAHAAAEATQEAQAFVVEEQPQSAVEAMRAGEADPYGLAATPVVSLEPDAAPAIGGAEEATEPVKPAEPDSAPGLQLMDPFDLGTSPVEDAQTASEAPRADEPVRPAEPTSAVGPAFVDPFDLGALPDSAAESAPPAPSEMDEFEKTLESLLSQLGTQAASERAPGESPDAPAPALDPAGQKRALLGAEAVGSDARAVADAAPAATEAAASESSVPAGRPRVRRPEWPEEEESGLPVSRPLWARPWFAALVILALFGVGWLLGRVDASNVGKSFAAVFQAIGMGPAHYEVAVTSTPAGAWIKVDGVDQAKRTPATLELKPGPHEIVLSIAGEGGSKHTVRGQRGQRVPLDVELWGSLRVLAPETGGPMAVTVDGMPRGFAPLDVNRLPPGIHRVQFSGPGVAPWEQTVEVGVNGVAELVARPIVAPATGMLEIRARLNDEMGSYPLPGATVWIDGAQRGVTPLRLELPRGPHSVRVRSQGEEAPIQVVELPGGNERFATVDFGLSVEHPRLAAELPGAIPLGRPTVLSATLDRVRQEDVREMWLHVRTPEGAWRRYQMNLMKAVGGVAGVTVFPAVLFDEDGRTTWYVSASMVTGDEYFTELKPAQAGK